VKVKELMSEEVVAVEPETTLKDVASLLVEHRISGVPVVDAERKVLGVVSEADIVVKEQGAKPGSRILDWLLGGGFGSWELERLSARTAEQAMSSPAITIGAGKEVFQAARLMTEHGVKRLPVVDDTGALIGIVTRSDLVRAFARSDDELAHEIEEMVRLTLLIEDEALHVHVHDGEVHLSGSWSAAPTRSCFLVSSHAFRASSTCTRRCAGNGTMASPRTRATRASRSRPGRGSAGNRLDGAAF
jgi:CBS domain-containing protein